MPKLTRTLLYISVVFLGFNPISAQVYNYFPITYWNIDVNPAYVSSEKSDFKADLSHLNNFSSERQLHTSRLQVSKLFERQFSGVGLSAGHTVQHDSLSYSNIGLVAGYRTIFFEKVYWRIGANYKFVNVNAPDGQFSRYHFESSNGANYERTVQTVNLSTIFSSSKESVYLIAGVMNLVPNIKVNEGHHNLFPRYYYFKVGNAMKFINGFHKVKELSVLVYAESVLNGPATWTYQSTYFNNYNLSRNANLRYGGDLAYHEIGYLQVRPTLVYFKYLGWKWDRKGDLRKKFITAKLFADISMLSAPKVSLPPIAYSASITYIY